MNLLNDKNIAIKKKKPISLSNFSPSYKDGLLSKEQGLKMLEDLTIKIAELQTKLYAQDKYSLLLVFQAMDAAGKDGTIHHVFSGINPQGCQVVSFKKPSVNELDHDYIWRVYKELPERGRIGIFNRSHYEEVIVTKVHPEYILGQRIPGIFKIEDVNKNFWAKRYETIREMEKHLTDNGTVILKFFLNVSKEEQKKRFLERINDPTKNWKFSYQDIIERKYWNQYQKAYEKAIEETSTPKAPWFIIPSDDNWFRHLAVSNIIYQTLKSLNLKFPVLDEQNKSFLAKAKIELEAEKEIVIKSPKKTKIK